MCDLLDLYENLHLSTAQAKMPETRRTKDSSPNRSSLDDHTKTYLKSLIEPLAKSEEVASLRALIEQQKAEIANLKTEISAKDARIAALETESARLSHNADLMRRKVDDVEQYDRRYCCRINGIPAKKDGEKEDVKELVKQCYADMGLAYDENKIDRAHRVGKPRYNKSTNSHVQQVIVKFRSWESRCAFYRARPKISKVNAPADAQPSSAPASSASTSEGAPPTDAAENEPRPDGRSFTVALDLTHDRSQLLKFAREQTVNNPDVKFAFADINCRLTLRMVDGSFQAFSSKGELEQVLLKYAGDVPILNEF